MTNPEMIELVLAYHAALTVRPGDEIFLAAVAHSDDIAMTLIKRSLAIEKRETLLLQERDYAVALDRAASAIEKAARTLLSEDADIAQLILTDLTDSAQKDELQVKLDKVFTQIHDAAMVLTVEQGFETSLTLAIAESEAIINTFPDGAEKTSLLEHVVTMRTVITEREAERRAYAAVGVAEISGEQVDIDAAQIMVDQVTDPVVKAALQHKLDLLTNVIATRVAQTAVLLAEQSRLQSDIDIAKPLVNALIEEDVKRGLLDRILLIATI